MILQGQYVSKQLVIIHVLYRRWEYPGPPSYCLETYCPNHISSPTNVCFSKNMELKVAITLCNVPFSEYRENENNLYIILLLRSF